MPGAALFAKVGELLMSNGRKLSGGTIVDATLIAAPSPTKNDDGTRDPEMHQTRKGNQWHFGMKVHIGVDSKSGLAHSASVTPANVHDSQELAHLLHGNESRPYGDSAYANQKEVLKDVAPKAKDFTNKRAYQEHPWICQGALPRANEECESRLCAAGADQYWEVGAAADRRGAPAMGKMRGSPAKCALQGTMGDKNRLFVQQFRNRRACAASCEYLFSVSLE